MVRRPSTHTHACGSVHTFSNASTASSRAVLLASKLAVSSSTDELACTDSHIVW